MFRRIIHHRSFSVSHHPNMRVVPVPVRDDNYAYLLIDEPSNKAAAVDPYDVPKVAAAAHDLGVHIVAAITTHHHFDHSGGNKVDFAAKYPDVPIYGGSNKVPALTKLVKDKDEFTLGDNTHIKCLATPCHTQDSICYYVTDSTQPGQPASVFTGDTLFIAGCGRFFEGNGDEMNRALGYLGTLPDNTVVYNGHEYTAGSLAFAKSVDPHNEAIARLGDLVKKNKATTGLTTIGDEKEWNVFMRLGSKPVRTATSASTDIPESAVMDALRELKNNFRG
ncbi:Hydroxyacylglutathione hydrolase, mitochondrial [Hypsizygus marmoreus]|uniref:hydroxyacylglutathione hydrolase n=1 Tax=Hypsizygus marmoreus TaxID=39966 RepID=A0A369JJ31_HYPMA|nr:Hydroxyacylglutathione hydrolase, mitochondrial [Hypsizygus marmoreus]